MLSPDSRWIAYDSEESGQREVYLRPFPDASRKWQVSTSGGSHPAWNPNGKELFYRSADAVMVVAVAADGELTLGRPTQLFERLFLDGFDVSPDGERFIMAIPNESATPRPAQLNLVLNRGEELKRLVPQDE